MKSQELFFKILNKNFWHNKIRVTKLLIFHMILTEKS
ncbi:Uncharacterised protein [Fusobacterium necrophorum subsp. necrophorum]|nr:Uncharacterised protein [Fusobacterium necrophorum subsp. necrophorum]